MKKIKNIIIVGGGTAGWSTALNFLQKTNNNKITVISSKELPAIGVGESTTGRFNELIQHKNGNVKINEMDFLLKTGSTFKLGILHTNWHTIGESFTSPLGDNFNNEKNYPHKGYDYFRIYHIAKNLKFNTMIQSQLMLNNKLPFFQVNEDFPEIPEFNIKNAKIDFRFNHVAYHLDTFKVGQYIKEKVLENKRVNYIDDVVVDVEKNEDETLKCLILKSGKKILGDLFVDCSGFQRLLIEKHYKNNFISYENELLVNRAMPFHIKNKKNTIINNYTHVIAKKFGWMWDIPLQHRKGCGYVYCDKFITPDKAQEEIEKDLKIKIIPQKDIKFKAGRLEKFWCKNVLSTGLSSAFVEPLEATSIHMTVLQINHFIEQYYTENMNFNCENLIEQYNNEMTSVWDDIKDFIVLHYNSPRKDTSFWKEASNEKRKSKRLKKLLNIWENRMPREVDYLGGLSNGFYYFGNTLWYQILIGMKILKQDIAKKELESFDLLRYAEEIFDFRKNYTKQIMNKCFQNNYFYQNELKKLNTYSKVVLQ